MSNRTSMTEFLLLGFSEVRELQILHFLLFLGIYLVALTGNLLVITLVVLDSHLHTPMYFFLVNLSIIDLGSISLTVPKSMANSLLNTRSISYAGCVTQVFLFIFFTAVDFGFLNIMAYDRYIAICKPLHYETIMNRRACVQMAVSAWITGVLLSTLHTGNTFAITFCGSNTVGQFYCEIPQLLKLSCSDLYLGEVGVISFNVFLGISCFGFIIVSYIQIFKTMLRIPSGQGRQKAFSTCLPHLTVVSLLLCTSVFAYMNPAFSSPSGQVLVVGVLYSVVPPMMNPIIYGVRNKAIKGALKKLTRWRLFTKNTISGFLP